MDIFTLQGDVANSVFSRSQYSHTLTNQGFVPSKLEGDVASEYISYELPLAPKPYDSILTVRFLLKAKYQ
jgi:hypothetical protein